MEAFNGYISIYPCSHGDPDCLGTAVYISQEKKKLVLKIRNFDLRTERESTLDEALELLEQKKQELIDTLCCVNKATNILIQEKHYLSSQ